MSESVAEYLGIDISRLKPLPIVSSTKPSEPCPFRRSTCVKLRKGQAPVCSVRNPRGGLWIVCEHRLCSSTPKDLALNDYQRGILRLIADTIAPNWNEIADVAVQREGRVRRRVGTNSPDDSAADYFMVFVDKETGKQHPSLKPVILEMQGGGETSNTKAMTEHVKAWEAGQAVDLSAPTNVSSIETNAWRRQQEQFLIKGSVATRSNGKLVFVVGSRLFDKLMSNLTSSPTPIDVRGGWTLAVIAIIEDENGVGTGESISLGIDRNRTLFTDYGSFARSLTDQGQYDPDLFSGDFVTLDGKSIRLS